MVESQIWQNFLFLGLHCNVPTLRLQSQTLGFMFTCQVTGPQHCSSRQKYDRPSINWYINYISCFVATLGLKVDHLLQLKITFIEMKITWNETMATGASSGSQSSTLIISFASLFLLKCARLFWGIARTVVSMPYQIRWVERDRRYLLHHIECA